MVALALLPDPLSLPLNCFLMRSVHVRCFDSVVAPAPAYPLRLSRVVSQAKNRVTSEHVMRHDVVVTSYQVLSNEVNYMNPDGRSGLRHEKVGHCLSADWPSHAPLLCVAWRRSTSAP